MAESATSTEDDGFTADQAALEMRAADLIRAMDRGLASLPDPTAARGVGRRLGLDKTLAWKATRLAAASDLAGVLSVLPGDSGRRKLLAALASVTGEDGVEELRAAFRALDDEIADRSIDSATLAAMAAGGLDSETRRRQHRQARESACHAAARVFGSTARLVVQSHVFLRSGEDGTIQHRRLSTLLSLHRTGPGPFLVIQNKGRLREDWSSPDAATELIQTNATEEILFHGDGTSPRRRIDVAFTRSHSSTAGTDVHPPTVSMLIRVPSECAVLETLVDRTLDWPAPSGVANEAQHLGDTAASRGDSMRLPMNESLEIDAPFELNESIGDERDRQATLVDRCLTELGRVREDFIVHRLTAPWPVFASRLVMVGRSRPGSGIAPEEAHP